MSPLDRNDRWVDATRTVAGSPGAAYLASISKGSRRTVQHSMSSLASMVAGSKVDPQSCDGKVSPTTTRCG